MRRGKGQSSTAGAKVALVRSNKLPVRGFAVVEARRVHSLKASGLFALRWFVSRDVRQCYEARGSALA